ncbi:hypothetical protein L1887_54897 [Cichorium endivia]|nr:hypothetical protein L1887_54897 [Cichorium endivia]
MQRRRACPRCCGPLPGSRPKRSICRAASCLQTLSARAKQMADTLESVGKALSHRAWSFRGRNKPLSVPFKAARTARAENGLGARWFGKHHQSTPASLPPPSSQIHSVALGHWPQSASPSRFWLRRRSSSPRNLTLEELGHKPDATVLLFTVAWEHCRKGYLWRSDPSDADVPHDVPCFLKMPPGSRARFCLGLSGCRAAATMSIHRAATIAHLGSTLRQQQALNAFWHLVSQGCHFQAWQGRDMPIDLALVELPMPDPKASMQQQADPLSSWHTAAATESPRSQFLSSSPVFVARIWTSVAIGQTIERHYRQGASLLVPCEARLEVATPMTTKPSHQEEDHVERTGKALDFCASLLQTREPASADHKESQLKRFVLMLMRYTRVLLHYPFCRVDRDHRKAAQESISATVSTALGTLLSLGAKDDDDQEEDEEDEEEEEEGGGNDLNGANYHRRQLRGRCQNGSTRSDAPSSLTQPDLARSARVDRHLLELLAGLSLRALVFTLALIKHPLLPLASDSASSADDGERQRSDALLALGALEQLHQLGVVSPSLLRKARKAARLGGGI